MNAKRAFAPTPEQQAIVTAALSGANLMIYAYAGCGKTSTLELMAQALPPQPGLALAFNVKIKKELEKRFPAHFSVMTMNGLGHRAWSRTIGKRLTLDERKLGTLVTAQCKRFGFQADTDQWGTIRELVTLAMQAGLVPSIFPHKGLIPDNDDSWAELAEDLPLAGLGMIEIAREVLIESIKQGFAGVVSFDDQIYLPTLFGGSFPRFPLVMVDEAQDLSVLNHLMVKRSAAGQLIVVGDPKQAIYAFRGADSSSMGELRELRLSWIDLPLATTFRCPKSHVARQNGHAPGFTAWKDSAEGIITTVNPEATPQWRELVRTRPDVAVLCRNNAPLISLAFKLLRYGIGCHMLGRDIGKALRTLAKKILPLTSTPQAECLRLITEWGEGEIALARANKKFHKVAKIDDQMQSLLAVAENAPSAGALLTKLDDLFSADHGLVTLSTGHKAKGLEWTTVVHLDPWRIPSKYAMSDGAQEQEFNLRYVIETRAKRELILADLEGF